MNQIPNIEEEKTRCSCGRLVASPFSETVCSSFPFCQEEVGTFPNDPTGLCREFAIKFHRGDFIKDGEDNSELISDWFHQQLQKAEQHEQEMYESLDANYQLMIQKAREEEREKYKEAFEEELRSNRANLPYYRYIARWKEELFDHSELDQEVSK